MDHSTRKRKKKAKQKAVALGLTPLKASGHDLLVAEEVSAGVCWYGYTFVRATSTMSLARPVNVQALRGASDARKTEERRRRQFTLDRRIEAQQSRHGGG